MQSDGAARSCKGKKTQRDKDWPMIRRLVEAHYFQHRRTLRGLKQRLDAGAAHSGIAHRNRAAISEGLPPFQGCAPLLASALSGDLKETPATFEEERTNAKRTAVLAAIAQRA